MCGRFPLGATMQATLAGARLDGGARWREARVDAGAASGSR